MQHRFALLFAVAVTLTHSPLAQTPSTRSVPAGRPVAAALKPFTGCKVPGGPDLLQMASLPSAPMDRAAQTLTGPRKVHILDGVFTAWGFPASAPFMNLKIEQLPAASYNTEKADLISEFDAINAKGENTRRNYDLKPTLNGFEIYGFDRTAISPQNQLMGMYLFFDNTRHIATTAYFLNATGSAPAHFSSLDDYNGLREGFLNAYTLCVRKALGGAPVPAKAKAATKPKPKKTAAHRR